MNTMSLFNLSYLSVKIVLFFPFHFNHLNIFLVWIVYFFLVFVFVLFLLISYLGLVLWLICNTFFPIKTLRFANVVCLQTKRACFFVWLTLLCQTVFMPNLLSKLIEQRRVIYSDFAWPAGGVAIHELWALGPLWPGERARFFEQFSNQTLQHLVKCGLPTPPST